MDLILVAGIFIFLFATIVFGNSMRKRAERKEANSTLPTPVTAGPGEVVIVRSVSSWPKFVGSAVPGGRNAKPQRLSESPIPAQGGGTTKTRRLPSFDQKLREIHHPLPPPAYTRP